MFDVLCQRLKLGKPIAEHQFAKDIGRRWRFDWCWPKQMLALEQEGGVWKGGRHTSGAGFLKDMEKYNTAVIMGWRVLRCTPKMMENGEVFDLLKRAFDGPQRKKHRV